MEGKYIILGLCFIITAITITKIILKFIEHRQINSILSLMSKKSKEDKEIEQKIKDCINIIEKNNIERGV